mgnify:CR=1 FL=1
MPKEKGIDKSVSFIREGYLYITNRRKSFHSDIFETRLLGKKAICMGGQEAVELFYDTDKFERKNAFPKRVQDTLLGRGSVLSLDGEAHKHRKAMFMSIMSPKELDHLKNLTKQEWKKAIQHWTEQKQIVLYNEARVMMTKVACQWAGVPLPNDEKNIRQIAKMLSTLFESPAMLGISFLKGKEARNEAERWIVDLVTQVRDKKLSPAENTALYQFSWHRDLEGNLLPSPTVAVEILNILRPIVAISVYICYVALAVYHHPEEVKKVKSNNDYSQMFIQEVRRYYPFFPVIPAIVKKDFTWKGYEFKKGTLTMLDVYGTNHDPKLWKNPDIFNPERFINWDNNPFSFIPQGGGDHSLGHRCAGEWITIGVMKISLDFLVNQITYELPKQDLSYSFVNMPSIPKSKIILQNIQLI